MRRFAAELVLMVLVAAALAVATVASILFWVVDGESAGLQWLLDLEKKEGDW
jgi:hypothetical protein